LASPSDFGEIIKPFVFLDLFQIPATTEPLFGWHPHSGIATITVVQEGATSYEETTGQKGKPSDRHNETVGLVHKAGEMSMSWAFRERS
jgi:redox-sensitive bicupin YhaK (pirin superfamily)